MSERVANVTSANIENNAGTIMSNYAKGVRFERLIASLFCDQFIPIRSAGSRGPVDLVLLPKKDILPVVLVQVKTKRVRRQQDLNKLTTYEAIFNRHDVKRFQTLPVVQRQIRKVLICIGIWKTQSRGRCYFLEGGLWLYEGDIEFKKGLHHSLF
ncbi:MAG: hypothetical protein QW838_02945 [Candidatus Nitrosotenuis sp.]